MMMGLQLRVSHPSNLGAFVLLLHKPLSFRKNGVVFSFIALCWRDKIDGDLGVHLIPPGPQEISPNMDCQLE